MLSVAESAEMLGVSAARVRELIAQGLLPAQKVGRSWVLREADVVARMDARPRPGRPAGAAGRQGADELDGDDARAAGSRCIHELYEACRAQCEFRPSMAELESLQSDEERAFRLALSDFFLRQKQHELVRRGVY